jgi:hypothetical protein
MEATQQRIDLTREEEVHIIGLIPRGRVHIVWWNTVMK